MWRKPGPELGVDAPSHQNGSYVVKRKEPSKYGIRHMASRRQWAIERDRDLIEDALDDGIRIKRLRTWVTVRCLNCRHQVRIGIYLEQASKLKCSKCGTKDPIVQGREPLRNWSRYRRG